MCLSHKGWIRFQIRSHGRWDVMIQSELLLGPDPVQIVVFSFLACFVPLHLSLQQKFVKVCKTLGLGAGCVQQRDAEPQPAHVTAAMRGLAKTRSYCVPDETVAGNMCRNVFP